MRAGQMSDLILPITAGFFIGFLVGLTGMGGGALMTPFLILWLKMDPVRAVGTDLMFAAVTKIVGGFQHRAEENVEMRSVIWMAGGSLPAAFLAGRFVLHQEENLIMLEEVLPRILGVVLLVVSAIVLAKVLGILETRETDQFLGPSAPALVLIGIIGGTLVGLTSVGGGTVIMALLLLFYAMPLHAMVGLDVMHGALLTTVAALTYAADGQTTWQVVVLLLLGSLPGVWLGVRAVGRANVRLVRGGLSVLIMLAGLELLF